MLQITNNIVLIFFITLLAACGGGSSNSEASNDNNSTMLDGQQSIPISGNWGGEIFWGATKRRVTISIVGSNNSFSGALNVQGCFNDVSLKAEVVNADSNGNAKVIAFSAVGVPNTISVVILESNQLQITALFIDPEALGATDVCRASQSSGNLERI